MIYNIFQKLAFSYDYTIYRFIGSFINNRLIKKMLLV